MFAMELGLATFADLASGVSPEQRMRNLLEEAELADQLGLDVFAVKLELLLATRDDSHVTWSGRPRAALDGAGVWPRPIQEPLPVWIAVGGTPQSVVRAGALGLPLTVAIIGGSPERFAPLVELYRRAAREAGHDPATLPVA